VCVCVCVTVIKAEYLILRAVCIVVVGAGELDVTQLLAPLDYKITYIVDKDRITF